jgi:putative FmdB family regulatory protein
MPLYDYRCLVCRREEIDRLVQAGASPELDCPECGSPMVRPIRPASVVIAGAHRAARDDGALWSGDHRSQLQQGTESSTREVHYDVLRRSGFDRGRSREIS